MENTEYCNLVLVDEIRGDPVRSREALNQLITNAENYTVLIVNLTDIPLEILKIDLPARDMRVKYIDSFDEYLEVDRDHCQMLQEWLTALSALEPDWRLLKYSRLSEQNFSHPFFQALRKFHLVDHLVNKYRATSLAYFGDSRLGACLANYSETRGLPFFVFPERKIGGNVKRIAVSNFKAASIFVWNLFSETVTLLALKQHETGAGRNLNHDGKVACYAVYPSAWAINSKEIRYRYCGEFGSSFGGGAVFYLISILRENKDVLGGVKKLQKMRADLRACKARLDFSILESYGSFSEIIRSYNCFSLLQEWSASWKHARESGCFTWLETPIEGLMCDLRLGSLREIPKNIYTECCSRNSAKELGPRAILLPVYELLEGRAVTAGYRHQNVRAIGIQHGINYSLQIPRLVSVFSSANVAEARNSTPDLICVENKSVRRLFIESGLSPERVEVIGAPRLTSGIQEELRSPCDVTGRTSILIFDDLYSSERLLFCGTQLAKDHTVIFKPHPGVSMERIKDTKTEEAVGFKVASSSISVAEAIQRYSPLVAICSISGVILELLWAGVPVIIVPGNKLPIALRVSKSNFSIPLIGAMSEIRQELQQLHESSSYWMKRVESGRELFDHSVECFGDESVRKLLHCTFR